MKFIREITRKIIYATSGKQENNEVFYICGADVLPPPLEKDEEENLIKRLESGDNSVRSELTERNLRLVVYIAKKFENTGINVEDLISIGTIGLIKSIGILLATVIVLLINVFNPYNPYKILQKNVVSKPTEREYTLGLELIKTLKEL